MLRCTSPPLPMAGMAGCVSLLIVLIFLGSVIKELTPHNGLPKNSSHNFLPLLHPIFEDFHRGFCLTLAPAQLAVFGSSPFIGIKVGATQMSSGVVVDAVLFAVTTCLAIGKKGLAR